MEVKPLGKERVVNEEQPLKAFVSIAVIPAGSVTVPRFVHP